MIDRRDFLVQLSTSALLLPSLTFPELVEEHSVAVHYLPLAPVHSSTSRLPVTDGKRVPLSMDYFSIDMEKGLTLRAKGGKNRNSDKVYLRLQVAIDTREQDEVEVYLAKSGIKVGRLSIWYATALQLFETELNATPAQISEEGLLLKMIAPQKPLYLLASSEDNGSHILIHTRPESKKLLHEMSAVYSQRSVQPFGWLEGCVLDGLQELYLRKNDQKALATIREHLKLFLKPDGQLIYEDPLGKPSDNRFNNLEAGLPFSVIARHEPEHASLLLFLDYCKTRISNKEVKGNSLTTEGCYTIAYPLAAIARDLKQREWFEFALIELEERVRGLTDETAVYTRGWKDKGLKTYRNWGRGYTWFLLGLIRTTEILEKDSPFKNDSRIKYLKEVYVYYARLALTHQQPDHSWRAYLDLDETGYDTSATAGLGAALAHGQRLGLLADFSTNRLKQIRARLSKNLTPDGFLNGICQQNAAGEGLQKSEYRVIAQYVLGLMAQIDAHIK